MSNNEQQNRRINQRVVSRFSDPIPRDLILDETDVYLHETLSPAIKVLEYTLMDILLDEGYTTLELQKHLSDEARDQKLHHKKILAVSIRRIRHAISSLNDDLRYKVKTKELKEYSHE